jgi:hypothetical protein
MAKKAEPKLDEWQCHILGCGKCKAVDIAAPRTLVNVCLDGAKLLRDHLAAQQAPKIRARNRALRNAFEDDNYCSKKKMNEAMRYVGD